MKTMRKKLLSEEPIRVNTLEEIAKAKEIYVTRLQKIVFKCEVCNEDYIGCLCNFKFFICRKCNSEITRSLQTQEFKNEIVKKRQETCLKKYGHISPLKNKEVSDKMKKKCLDLYGVEHSFQREDVKEKINKTHIEKYGSIENFNRYLYEQQKKGIYKKYNVYNVSYVPEVVAKRKETFNEHKKDPLFLKNINEKRACTIANLLKQDKSYKNNIIEKRKETLLEKYGVDHNFKIPEVIEHRKKYFLEKFGYEVASKSQEVKDKTKETWLSKNKEDIIKINKKRGRKYLYENIYFDSWPEVCAYIYFIDHNINFIYQPEVFFTYKYNGVTYKYFPDFLVENSLIEIKGDHFFKDGKMINPYNRSYDEKSQEKYLCMQKYGIIILTSKEYSIYVDYVKSLNLNRKDFIYEK